MNTIKVTADIANAVVGDLSQAELFKSLKKEDLVRIAQKSDMIQASPNEVIMRQGDKSDSFYVVVGGEVIISVRHENRGEPVEVARVRPYDTLGELGLLLSQPRTATVTAAEESVLLKFNENFFCEIFRALPDFGLVACRVLAQRLRASSRSLLAPDARKAQPVIDPAMRNLLPVEFEERNRVLPLRTEGNIVYMGFTEDPTPHVVTMARELLPGMELRPVIIDAETFEKAMHGSVGHTAQQAAAAGGGGMAPASLDELLRRMVAEGASDVHLSAGQKPHWRIDGDIQEITDMAVMGSEDVLSLIKATMPSRNASQFEKEFDTDYAYHIPDTARFRVNVFRDNHGVSAVFRQIPDRILTIEQLGLPEIVRNMCDYPKGLILVTGPTGSGKSTTLAAMIDHINNTRKAHIITLEDPIEFVHKSRMCLVNQREIESHTMSFGRALRAALREDPDIVLVGEMRDLETVALALETANTGHLVFGTLHTNTAISTVDRIIDVFPSEQQSQIRTVLADTLKGVIAQTLCRRIGGGRVAALEILVSDMGIANLIREGKTHQALSAMQTGKARGNRLLNEELCRLVEENLITPDEALGRSVEKDDISSKLRAREAQAAQAAAQPAAARRR